MLFKLTDEAGEVYLNAKQVVAIRPSRRSNGAEVVCVGASVEVREPVKEAFQRWQLALALAPMG